MKVLFLIFCLFFLYSCNDPMLPSGEINPENNEPVIPVIGKEVSVAYIHLKSLSYEEIYQTAIREQVRDLLSRYDVLYIFIEAGEGLRYWDFGLVKLENNIHVKPWTTGDYNETRKWNYISHREELWQDSSAFDYNFAQHGYNTKFTKTPFGMHYYAQVDSQVRLNVLGVNLDHTSYEQESSSFKNLLDTLNYWNHFKTIAFGNFTKDCQNKISEFIIQEDSCPEQSVWISPDLQAGVKEINTLSPDQEGFDLISDKPIIEVIINI